MSMCISTAQARAKKICAAGSQGLGRSWAGGIFIVNFVYAGSCGDLVKFLSRGSCVGPVRVLSCGNPVKIFFRRSLWESLANAMS